MIRICGICMTVVAAMAILSACGQKQEGSTELASLTLSDFLVQAEQFIDKQVVLEGTVTHVCKHGGKRLHLTDTQSNDRMKVELGENLPAFARELEGSDIVITGVLRETRVDQQYLDEWEQEILEERNDEHVHEGHVDPQGLDAVKAKREELAASGKPYLSVWHVECTSYVMKDGSQTPRAKEEEAEEDHDHDHDH